MARVLLEHDPAVPETEYQFSRPPFAAQWIGSSEIPVDQGFWAFRRRVDGAAGRLRIHVSADQRYILFLNGQRIGRGPERGDLRHWMYETYDLDLAAGENTLVAIVWWLSPTGATPPPWAQITQRPGFWLNAEGDSAAAWHTGTSPWESQSVAGLSVDTDQVVHFLHSVVGPRVLCDGRDYSWGIEAGAGDGWQAPTILQPAISGGVVREGHPYWLLRPAMLPAMRDEPLGGFIVRHVDQPTVPDTINFAVTAANDLRSSEKAWNELATAKAVIVPAGVRRRVIIDLQKYACAYSRLITSGGRGAKVRLRWSESLYKAIDKPIAGAWDLRDKGNRDEIEGRVYVGTGDRFIADGGTSRVFEPLWWNAGRYLELLIETADEPLTIDSLELRATGYPYEFQSTFDASDDRLADVETLALHTLKMCSYETSVDCPYYEQLNYAGDTRLQSLVAMSTSRDDRLVRKSLRLFDWSRTGDNWTASRWPTSVVQTIPPFSMWWACMAHDYALWRGDLPFVRTLMPGVRSVMERCREQIGPDGLFRQPAGWNFVDWVDGWKAGVPSPEIGSPCGILQWQLIYTLMKAADLEEWLGEPLLAQRNRQTAAAMAASAERAYFDAGRGLLATDPARTKFSEHAQVLALLSGQLSANLRDSVLAGITGSGPIDRTTLYFCHYTFEALAEAGRTDLLLRRLDTWFDHRRLGLSTVLEKPEPSRSDCHAWGAHPAYHFYASILGIRPAVPGFGHVRITPRLGPLSWAKGEMVHPQGTIRVDLRQEDGRLRGVVELPAGVSGELVLPGEIRPLSGGVVNL